MSTYLLLLEGFLQDFVKENYNNFNICKRGNNSDSGDILSDEEEDLNRLLAASDCDSRQVFICF